YGPTVSYGLSTPLDPTSVTAHTVGITGLADNTNYHYRVKSKDASNNLATSGDATFTTLDGTPPQLGNVAVINITTSEATIVWTTNEPADSQVEYGLTASYGLSTTLDPSLVTSHTVILSGLTDNTTYHYRVNSKDASGNLATGSDAVFALIKKRGGQVT